MSKLQNKNSTSISGAKVKESFASHFFDGFNVILLGVLAFIMIYPLLHVAFASFSDGYALMAHRGLLLHPLGITLDGYKLVFKEPMLLRGYINTAIVVIGGTGFAMVLTVLGGYVLAKKELMLRKPIMIYIIITMYFTGGMIPFFMTVRDLGMYNSLWALIIPSSVSTFNLIIMRTGFEGIPESLIDAARIDGASHLTILWKIVIPLAKPTMAVITLYYAVAKWNAWFNAFLFIRDREKYPLQLVLRGLLIEIDANAMSAGTDAGEIARMGETMKYGTIMVATLPILLFYPFLQKYFVKGVMIGGVKG